MIDGRTVMEVDPNGRSASEVDRAVGLYFRPARKEFPPHRVRGARRGAGHQLRPVRVPSAASAAAWSASKGRAQVASEPKPFASLSSGLLARKGAARPAMRPQGFGQMGGGNSRISAGTTWASSRPSRPKRRATTTHDAFGEDVVEHPRVHPTGADSGRLAGPSTSRPRSPTASRADDDAEDEEVDETAELYEPKRRAAEPSSRRAEPSPSSRSPPCSSSGCRAARRAPRSAPGSKGKAAFTLRLDPARHLKLRLACAVDGRSAQQLVTDALDQLLADMPELDAMAEKAKRKG